MRSGRDYLVSMTASGDSQDALYREVVEQYGAALARLARGYERDPHLRQDLLQDIHAAIWASLGSWQRRCSLRTWVYRVAHNTAVSHISRARQRPSFVSLEELAEQPATANYDAQDAAVARRQVLNLVEQLAPTDRQIILLYLEDVDGATIGDIVGLSPSNVSVKVHRIKKLLSSRFHDGRRHDA
jgi:RNA polymerase sigma-70 factor, ECF subfamily